MFWRLLAQVLRGLSRAGRRLATALERASSTLEGSAAAGIPQRLRERFPDAPEHWLQDIAARDGFDTDDALRASAIRRDVPPRSAPLHAVVSAAMALDDEIEVARDAADVPRAEAPLLALARHRRRDVARPRFAVDGEQKQVAAPVWSRALAPSAPLRPRF